jgi:hypothetical protein
MAETVTVGCTIAGGLRLRLFDRVVDGDTGREAWKPRGDGVLLKGHDGLQQRGIGYTEGVDAAFFAEWMKQNADSTLVATNQVWLHRKESADDKGAT